MTQWDLAVLYRWVCKGGRRVSDRRVPWNDWKPQPSELSYSVVSWCMCHLSDHCLNYIRTERI